MVMLRSLEEEKSSYSVREGSGRSSTGYHIAYKSIKYIPSRCSQYIRLSGVKPDRYYRVSSPLETLNWLRPNYKRVKQ